MSASVVKWICSVCGELKTRPEKDAHQRVADLVKKDPHPGESWEVSVVIPTGPRPGEVPDGGLADDEIG
jgi:hypothetical protein